MSFQGEVRVYKKDYTPRNKLLQGRMNYSLKFTADVDKKSYLLVARGFIFQQINKSKYIERVNTILSRQDWYDSLNNIVKELESEKKRRENVHVQISYSKRPVIPGTTLKGMSRSRLEYKFSPKNIAGSRIAYSCYAVQEYSQSVPTRHQKFWGIDNAIMREQCRFDDKNRKVCIVCDMFGTGSLGSRVSFSNALFPRESLTQNGTMIKPGSRGELTVLLRNFNETELGLFLLSLEIFSGSPVIVGFYKYRYNPVVGIKSNAQVPYYGLVKFNLEDAYSSDGLGFTKVDVKNLVSTAESSLKHSEYNQYLDYTKGVIQWKES